MIRRPPRSTLFPYPTHLRPATPAGVSSRPCPCRSPRARSRRPPPPPIRPTSRPAPVRGPRSEEHTSELQSRQYLVCRLLLENKTACQSPVAEVRSVQLTVCL